jgi:hypothetical protein
MALCQDASGSCVRTGECTFDGDCFRTECSAYRQAARKVRRLADANEGMVASALREAAAHLDTKAAAASELAKT